MLGYARRVHQLVSGVLARKSCMASQRPASWRSSVSERHELPDSLGSLGSTSCPDAVLGAHATAAPLASLHDVLLHRAHDGFPLFNEKAWGNWEIGVEEVRDVAGKAGEQRLHCAIGTTSCMSVGERELRGCKLDMRFVARRRFEGRVWEMGRRGHGVLRFGRGVFAYAAGQREYMFLVSRRRSGDCLGRAAAVAASVIE